jgi:hypothetical protein
VKGKWTVYVYEGERVVSQFTVANKTAAEAYQEGARRFPGKEIEVVQE